MAAARIDADERQITRDSAYDHLLDNNDNFSPDDRFLVFDTRTAAGINESALIAKVEIATGKITPLYRPEHANKFGPGVAAASFAHNRNEVIFIHGPLQPTGADNQYEKHRRVGGIVSGDGSGVCRFADARNTKPPYTVGALRGGTHRHEFSGDDQWIGFTYNDAVMRAQGLKIGKNLDLRTIGVTKLGHPVRVPEAGQFSTQTPASRRWSWSSRRIHNREATRFHTPPAIAGSASMATGVPMAAANSHARSSGPRAASVDSQSMSCSSWTSPRTSAFPAR